MALTILESMISLSCVIGWPSGPRTSSNLEWSSRSLSSKQNFFASAIQARRTSAGNIRNVMTPSGIVMISGDDTTRMNNNQTYDIICQQRMSKYFWAGQATYRGAGGDVEDVNVHDGSSLACQPRAQPTTTRESSSLDKISRIHCS